MQANTVFAERYELVSILASGGFSKVYRAIQLGVDRPVAIKVLNPIEQNASSTVEERFFREAKLISKLSNPNIVMMHDYGKYQDRLFMVFEFIDGKDLSDITSQGRAFSVERSVHIVSQILHALDEAHAMRVVHRDIKPSNVMLFDRPNKTDSVKILDFGIAKTIEEETNFEKGLTGDGVLIGTPRYMAPEQLMLKRLSPASDIYSLGLLWLELLNGRKPFEGLSMREVIEFKMTHDVELPVRITGSLRNLLQSMLSRDPADRPPDAAAVLAEIERVDFDEIEMAAPIMTFPLGVSTFVPNESANSAPIAASKPATNVLLVPDEPDTVILESTDTLQPTGRPNAGPSKYLTIVLLSFAVVGVVAWFARPVNDATEDSKTIAVATRTTVEEPVTKKIETSDKTPAVDVLTAVFNAASKVEDAVASASGQAEKQRLAMLKRAKSKKVAKTSKTRAKRDKRRPKKGKKFEPKAVD